MNAGVCPKHTHEHYCGDDDNDDDEKYRGRNILVEPKRDSLIKKHTHKPFTIPPQNNEFITNK